MCIENVCLITERKVLTSTEMMDVKGHNLTRTATFIWCMAHLINYHSNDDVSTRNTKINDETCLIMSFNFSSLHFYREKVLKHNLHLIKFRTIISVFSKYSIHLAYMQCCTQSFCWLTQNTLRLTKKVVSSFKWVLQRLSGHFTGYFAPKIKMVKCESHL